MIFDSFANYIFELVTLRDVMLWFPCLYSFWIYCRFCLWLPWSLHETATQYVDGSLIQLHTKTLPSYVSFGVFNVVICLFLYCIFFHKLQYHGYFWYSCPLCTGVKRLHTICYSIRFSEIGYTFTLFSVLYIFQIFSCST